MDCFYVVQKIARAIDARNLWDGDRKLGFAPGHLSRCRNGHTGIRTLFFRTCLYLDEKPSALMKRFGLSRRDLL